MWRRLASIAAALLLLCMESARAESWPGGAFSSVRLFAWPADHTGLVVSKGGKLTRGALIAKGLVLTKREVQEVAKAQQRRYTPRPRAGCYVPHNAFIFYDAAERPVAFLEVCFDCLAVRTWPADPECDPDYLALARICAAHQVPFGRFKSVLEMEAEVGPMLNAAVEAP